jgi:hypothetical protein
MLDKAETIMRTGNTGFAIGAESLPENQESDQFGFWVVTKKIAKPMQPVSPFAHQNPLLVNQDSDQFRSWVKASARQR